MATTPRKDLTIEESRRLAWENAKDTCAKCADLVLLVLVGPSHSESPDPML